jgi:hypothetical protein
MYNNIFSKFISFYDLFIECFPHVNFTGLFIHIDSVDSFMDIFYHTRSGLSESFHVSCLEIENLLTLIKSFSDEEIIE